jgi:uncharacterized phage protein (TIGR01671 family)
MREGKTMREILFRGRRIDNGEWAQGYYAKAKDYMSEKEIHVIFLLDLELFPHSEFSSYEEVDHETVGQYTGLTDKNGTKIFEGDVVKGFNNFHDREEQYVIRHTGVGLLFCEYGNEWHPDYIEQAEVIGNIHDNPELIGGTE